MLLFGEDDAVWMKRESNMITGCTVQSLYKFPMLDKTNVSSLKVSETLGTVRLMLTVSADADILC